MPAHAVRKRLGEDVGQWLTDGLVRADQAALLRERWAQAGFGAGQVAKYFGYMGGLFVMAGLLGFVAATSGSQVVAALELVVVGTALFSWGARLTRDPRGKYGLSSRTLLAVGFFSAALGFGVAADAFHLTPRTVVLVTGALFVPSAFVIAYRLRNTFVLVLGLIALFHWMGSWTGMIDRSTYEIDIEDPRAMAAASALACAFGAVHDRIAPRARAAFGHAWSAVALTYLNLSLLILTVSSASPRAWIVAWALAGVVQIVVGARLHSALFTAFGVVAIAVNLFTRYFETLWDALDAGLFFLVGGAILFGAGFGLETLTRKKQTS